MIGATIGAGSISGQSEATWSLSQATDPNLKLVEIYITWNDIQYTLPPRRDVLAMVIEKPYLRLYY